MKKQQKKPMNFILKLEVYPFEIMFSFGESDQVLRNKLHKYDLTLEILNDSLKLPGIGKCILFPGNQCLVRLWSVPYTPKGFSCLIHELFHAVTFIMDRIGMELIIEKSDEAYAYLMGYITEKVFEKLGY